MKRRTRICASNLTGVRYYKKLLHPRNGYIALGLWSHKILRWLAPLPFIGLVLSTVFLSSDSFFRFILIGVIAFFFCALLGAVLSILNSRIKYVSYCTYFVLINTGLFWGIIRFLFNLQKPYWETKNRPS